MIVSFTRTSLRAKSLMFLLFMLSSSLIFAQNLIPTGSMTMDPGQNRATTGWTMTLTPDINSTAGCYYASQTPIGWKGTASESPDGGSWAGLVYIRSSGFTAAEGLAYTVNSLTVGKKYTLTYYWAVTPPSYVSYNFTDQIRPVLTVTGLSGTPTVNAYSSSAWNWYTVTQTFTASSTTATFAFMANSPGTGNSSAYMGLDGVSLTPACTAPNVAPSPTSSRLAVCGSTANLTSLEGAPPANMQYRWHTATPGSDGNLVANPSSTSAPGTYYMTTYDPAGLCYSPTSTAVTVTSATPVTPVITASDPTCAVPTGTISVNSSVPGITYTLSPGGATSTAGSFTGLAAGSYTVTASNGTCASGASNTVNIAAAPNCIIADLRPLYVMSDVGYIKPSALSKNATLRIFNVGQTGSVSSGPISVYIYPPNNEFSLALGAAPGWAMTYDAGGNYYTLTSTSETIAYGATNFKAVPLVITAAPTTSKGKYTINFEIADGSGGETNNLNNTVPIELTVSEL